MLLYKTLIAASDGRRNGDYLTQGLTPSRLTKIPSITNAVNSFAQLDPSIFGGNTVTNMMRPSAKMNPAVCEAFLRAVAPSYGVIPCGVDNSYGHPSPSVLMRLQELGITCLRSDVAGDVVFVTDGDTLTVRD